MNIQKRNCFKENSAASSKRHMEVTTRSVKLLLRTLDLKILCHSNVRGCSELLKAWGKYLLIFIHYASKFSDMFFPS